MSDEEIRRVWNIPTEYVSDKIRTNSWVQNTSDGPILTYQTWNEYRRPVQKDPVMTEESFKNYFESISKEVPKASKLSKGESNMLTLMLTDIHYGVVTRDDKGQINYSPQILEQKLWNLLQAELPKLIDAQTDTLMVCLGHDMLHVDNPSHTTSAGTSLVGDAYGTYHQLFSGMVSFLHSWIDHLTDTYSNLNVVISVVPGNHDSNTSNMTAIALRAIYSKNKRVVVVHDESGNSFFRYGKNLLGLTHGDHIKNPDRLAGLMMSSRPIDYDETISRYWLLGHEHRAGEKVLSEWGVHIRWSPSLCPPNVWAKSKGFVNATEGLELLKFDHDLGITGIYPIGTHRL
jgi:hypothetical protein